jgi:hypothetical protein
MSYLIYLIITTFIFENINKFYLHYNPPALIKISKILAISPASVKFKRFSVAVTYLFNTSEKFSLLYLYAYLMIINIYLFKIFFIIKNHRFYYIFYEYIYKLNFIPYFKEYSKALVRL